VAETETKTPAKARGIDPRGPRFGAGITAVLLLIVIGLALGNLYTAAFIVFAVVTLGFVWGTFAGIQNHPYGLLFKKLIRPRLAPPTELEDPTPPTFAQGVGFVITLIGVILYVAHLPIALPIAAAAAFIAAFLNSVFGYCLGCQLYLLLVRAGILGRQRSAAA
jgi:hypothetical protein